MSSPELKKAVKAGLFKLEKDRSRRKKLNRVQGQLFIFAYKDFIDAITNKLKASKVPSPKTVAKELEEEFSKNLNAVNLSGVSKVKKNEMERVKASILKGEFPAPVYGKINSNTHKIFLVKSYSQVSRIKTKIGKKLNEETGVDSSVVTGKQASGSQRENLEGLQLGHGEYGAAVSATRVLAAEQILSGSSASNLNASDKRVLRDLRRKIEEYKREVEVIAELEANTVVDNKGNFKASFIPIISGQFAKENQEDAKKEAQLLRDMQDAYTDAIDVLNQKGSRSNKEAIEDTFISNFSGRKGLKYTGNAKPAKKINKKSKSGKVKEKSKDATKVSIAAGAAVPETKKGSKRSSNISSVPFAMISVFNKELPQTLKKNMNNPRLNYVTGRFANSVEVTNVTSTAKGFPSFSYTYDKYPYQTFEPGYKQGSQQRDPRKLIDSSMREIAAKYALGRFFTRRQ